MEGLEKGAKNATKVYEYKKAIWYFPHEYLEHHIETIWYCLLFFFFFFYESLLT